MPHQCTACNRTFPDGSKGMLSGCPDCGGNKFRYLPEGADGEVPAEESPDPPDPPNGGVAETVRGAATTVRDLVGSSPDSPPRKRPRDRPAPDERGQDSDLEPATADVDSSSGDDPADAGPPVGGSSPEGTSTGAASRDPGSVDDARTDTGSVGAASETPAADATAGSATADTASGSATADTASGSAAADTGAGTTDATPEDTAQASARASVVDPDELPDAPGEAAGGATTSGTAPDGEPTGDDPGASDDGPDLSELRQELNDQFESIKIVEPGQYELNLMELYDRDEYIISLMEDGRYVIEVPETWRGDRE